MRVPAMLAAVSAAPPGRGRAAKGGQGNRPLVIGCGFIGSHVVAELAADGRPPVVLTRSQPAGGIAAADLHRGDASDPGELERALEGVGHVVYCAGGLLPAASEKEPERDAELTLAPLRAVLDALGSRPETGLTYVSSGGTVYGEPEEVPVPETAPTLPVGSYGRLHVACEEEIARRREEHDLRARVLRCATVYGEHQRPDRGQGAVVTFLHRIEQGLPIDLYGGGATVRDYVYAGDVARALVALIDREEGPAVLNVGSGEGTSLLDLLRLVETQVGRPAEVRSHPERGFDVHRIVLDTSSLRGLVEFEPTPLAAGIARTHAWLQAVARSSEAGSRPPLHSAR
ncbi:MAG TPA: NAD-dependent epimerase/dehydratase family protein [Solirubrobacterales bacterium]|nr:NAD-dependent epimerase/dehydratase family protein [Solirubrobacterales bacterium]